MFELFLDPDSDSDPDAREGAPGPADLLICIYNKRRREAVAPLGGNHKRQISNGCMPRC